MPAEVILIGGASIVINYGFREMTYDMDAIIEAASSMKDSINYIGDKYGLPNGWLNTDFMKTASYTSKLSRYSTYYKTYSNIVTFRTVTGKYLLAMKLMAGRLFKFDRSDVIGILWEQEKNGEPLSLEDIKEAIVDLYGSYDVIPEDSAEFIERAIQEGNYGELYQSVRQMELESKDILLQFQKDSPGIARTDNVNEVLDSLRSRMP